MFQARSPTITALLCGVLVGAPALLALALFHITGDPRLQPLSLTEARNFRVAPPVAEGVIRVEVHWSSMERDTDPALHLARDIKATFLAKGHDAWVIVLRDPQATASYVSYHVGRNVFGPFSVAEAPRGVEPALRAARSNDGVPPPVP